MKKKILTKHLKNQTHSPPKNPHNTYIYKKKYQQKKKKVKKVKYKQAKL